VRLDLFLTVSRLVKRRSAAKSLIDRGGVRVAGAPVKAGRKLARGDELEITLGQRELRIRVMGFAGRGAAKAAARDLYEVLEENLPGDVSHPPEDSASGEDASFGEIDGPIDFLEGR
jgi:ribosomal 50S subunit-recycling heat shock protein